MRCSRAIIRRNKVPAREEFNTVCSMNLRSSPCRVPLPSALYHSFLKLEFRASSTKQNAPEKSAIMAVSLRGAFSVMLCLFPEVPLPAFLADGFCLGLPGAEGAFADAGFAGKGGTAEARPLAEGQNLPGLSRI